MNNVLLDICEERTRQEEKWGQQNHPDWHGDFSVGFTADWARMVNDLRAKRNGLAWDWILLEEVAEALEADSREHLREELVQVCAVAIAWVEAIDRRAGGSA